MCVQLAFGKGYFNPGVITIKNNPAAFNDEKLAARWKSMIDSGLDSWSSMDVLGMEHFYNNAQSKSDDIDDAAASSNNKTSNKTTKTRPVPFGSGILPLSSIPGGGLENLPLEQLENTITFMLNRNGGILGDVSPLFFANFDL